MDTELARTFLAVVAAGNFVSAAERLFITQSTVSTRIRALEEQLGCRLFVRNKAGTRLTLAGRRFQKHASILVRTVEQARQEIGVPPGFDSSLTIGARFGLWDGFLLDWLPTMRRARADVRLRVEIGFEVDLMAGLVEGRFDMGVMYTPQSRPGLRVEHLFDEKLVLVSTRPVARGKWPVGYVYVDWGPEFYATHNANFPEFDGAGLTANIGWLGLEYILRAGGAGYFPHRLVEKLESTGQVHFVENTPVFVQPAYVVHPVESPSDSLRQAIESLRVASRQALNGDA